MPIVRSKHSFDGSFTQIPNFWLRDPKLSLKAIGLLAQLMSHEPGWSVSVVSVARQNGVSRGAVSTAVAELEAAGYLIRTQKRSETNQFAEVIWTTCDPREPVTGFPSAAFPSTAFPSAENRAPKKTIKTEDYLKEEERATPSTSKRINPDFTATPTMLSWASENGLTVDPIQETAKFVDYWTAESGSRAAKSDWVAAWRNWMRRAQQYRPATADVDPWAGKKHLGFDA